MQPEIAVFGGGCFWCTEALFKELRGVISVIPGYAGGATANPTYEKVCSGTTGHAEVIRITFNPSQISYRDLLTVFFATHNPTTRNRQGSDVGTQYRSIILYATNEQRKEAQTFINDLDASNADGKPIVTEVMPLEKFYEAETSHRDYFRSNPDLPYCQIVIKPKVLKLQKEFESLLKEKKVIV